MAARVLAFDWSATPLGPIEAWPLSLKSAVATCLYSRFQMAIYWGPELNCIYNDAERAVLGGLHPAALGMPGCELLSDSWEVVGPQLQAVMRSEGTTWAEDQPLTFDRRGIVEVGYFTYSYSPILDDQDGVGGVLLVSQDTTARVLAERRLDVLRELATRSMTARTGREACELAAEALEGRADFPFTLIYLIEGDGNSAACAAASGLSGGLEPQVRVKLTEPTAGAARVLQRTAAKPLEGILVDSSLFVASTRDRQGTAKRCFAFAISRGSTEPLAGFFVAGVNDECAPDSSYRNLVELVSLGIGRSITVARAREAERERARSVAAVARAKSALFSDASHELRTPLTLILGPLDQVLDDADLPASARQQISVARRSAVRMLKLVNALLDFSLIDAGGRAGAFQPTDLAQLTRDIAAMFRSTAERAALRLSVDCPPLADRAYVDREAWERILSNLLSNALKFTPKGAIDIRLREEHGHFVLTVEDTGIGVAPQDLDQIFSRLYRCSDPRALTREGSGIGLALVRELVRLHGGTIAAQRRPGSGTRMLVRIPAGREHLSSRVIADEAPGAAGDGDCALSVEEVSGWLSGDDQRPRRVADRVWTVARQPTPVLPARAEQVDRVLLVEDDGDMRDYLWRLLTPYYPVDVARDGAQAIEMAVGDQPSIVVADVMMPDLDGFAVVHAIREDPRTRDIPVMLISARADPDSRMRALDVGADDYVVKPFSPRELVARLQATLDTSHLRAQDAEARGRDRERALRQHELRALLDDLRAAQRRVAAAADAERRRIEGNLHDGAQQRLMAIRLELGLLGELLEHDPVAARAELDRLRAALDEALDELRELAHGLYPPLLASDGLHAALAAAALRGAIPVTVEGANVSRLPRAIESAAYFACLEAVQNVAKHAGDGAQATIRLELSDDALAFSVSDDGAGFDVDAASHGQGLMNLRDRLGALSGSAEITSAPGRGTTVLGRIPLP